MEKGRAVGESSPTAPFVWRLAAATAATAVTVSVTVMSATATAAETAVRKQDDDNDKNQQTIVTEPAEVHNAPPFP